MEEVNLPTRKAKANIILLRVSPATSSQRLSRALTQSALQVRLQGKAGIIPSNPSKPTKVALAIKASRARGTPHNHHPRPSTCLYSSFAKQTAFLRVLQPTGQRLRRRHLHRLFGRSPLLLLRRRWVTS